MVPKGWMYSKPSKLEVRNSTMVTATHDVRKMFIARLMSHCVAISSPTKRSPPMGAPKAAETPPATPAAMKSRRSAMFRNILSFSLRKGGNPCAWLMMDPSTEPMWIMGPSGPHGRPDPTARAQEANLANNTEMLKVYGMITPLRKTEVSGMPDPAAKGSMKMMMAADVVTSNAQAQINLPHNKRTQGPAPSSSPASSSITPARRSKSQPTHCLRRKLTSPHTAPTAAKVAQRIGRECIGAKCFPWACSALTAS
mmetsp:Transcript_69669/g.157517  ORF Transcript_69669/g.157517 Transcript_69669/m.157517 type:complete len:254 (-) Transcript_69669:444-1205(-)